MLFQTSEKSSEFTIGDWTVKGKKATCLAFVILIAPWMLGAILIAYQIVKLLAGGF
jgi:hypothetical protein